MKKDDGGKKAVFIFSAMHVGSSRCGHLFVRGTVKSKGVYWEMGVEGSEGVAWDVAHNRKKAGQQGFFPCCPAFCVKRV
ncbi:hypothetical protein KIY57_10580 [Heyndrickxia coagulans]|nr:hypothetical protein KIY57_10580 [Heyndrickxia coagulans]